MHSLAPEPLVAADVIHRGGSRGHDYGDMPKGLLMIDTQGHYSLQIYDSLRPRYASGDRARGTPNPRNLIGRRCRSSQH